MHYTVFSHHFKDSHFHQKMIIYLIVVCSFYTIVQVPPAPNVTVTPDAIDIGPAVITL